jgi:two-component system OmpR family response regulator
MAARIVIIDASPDESDAAYLNRNGLAAEAWTALEPMLRRLAGDPPALVVLNRRLGREPGLAALRRLRAVSAVPVLLRAMDADDEVDRVTALELGADGYLRRGTGPRELLAQIRCVLRRARPPAMEETSNGWRLCPRRRELLSPEGEARHLTSAEFELMHNLTRQQGEPVSRDALSLAVLRRSYHPEDRALDNLVLRLRRKLGDDGPTARLIKSVRGIGYVFVGFDALPQRRERMVGANDFAEVRQAA